MGNPHSSGQSVVKVQVSRLNVAEIGEDQRSCSAHDRVFMGHNGADSYYSGRGFRCWLNV